MKQVLQNARSGSLELAEVPAPMAVPGQVLVRNHYSVMSPGTDRMAMSFARSSMLQKARSRPDLVQQVLRKLSQEGPMATYRTVTTRLETPQTMGYSCAGVVEAVGAGVTGFAVGDRVACAGAGYASHAEMIVVPENLCAPVPKDVSLKHAAFSTLGAIALQGIRVGNPTLGECTAVVGLGLIGQLTVQLLNANGCRVIGLDLDAGRTEQALLQGAQWAATPDSLSSSWKDLATDGHGVDLAIVTAAASTSAPLHLAAELCRQKGRIAFVGAMPMDLDRRTMYDKELDLRMSTSYGPGRYDRSFEEMGLDYPVAYVRWTENRNLRAFLDLLDSSAIDLNHLDTEVRPIEQAIDAYEALVKGSTKSLAVIFEYGEEISRSRTLPLTQKTIKSRNDEVGVGFIGAGNYAKGVLLPILERSKKASRISLVTATGASARKTAEKFGFSGCGTDPEAVLKDPNIELVFIATRHDTHVDLAIEALQCRKAVWLEKPVAITVEGLDKIGACVAETGGFLTVGYNRRFSPHARAAAKLFEKRSGPVSINYTIAAGNPPRGTWLMDPKEGGGRIIGEACHFVDLCNFLVGDLTTSVYSRALGRDPGVDDSMVSVLHYPDGSMANIAYLAQTSSKLPKERFEISGDGLTASCDNFRTTQLSRGRDFRTFNQDKGQANAVDEVLDALRRGTPSPLGLDALLNVSRVTFAMHASAACGAPVEVSGAPVA